MRDEGMEKPPTGQLVFVPGEPIETLRDKFAGLTLQGLISSATVQESNEVVAGACYKMADAMLQERDKAKKQP